MKFCANCGQRMPDEDMFCSTCGARFPQVQVPTGNPSAPVVASRTQPTPVVKPTNIVKPKPAAVNGSTPSGDLAMARNILLGTISIPDYGKALTYIARAQKMGASAMETQYLNLAAQLYRTLDMLRGLYQVNSNDGSQINVYKNPVSAGADPGSVSRAYSAGNRENHAKNDGKASTGDLLKSAAIGAVTGVVAQAITKNVLGQNGRAVAYQRRRTYEDETEPVAYYEEEPMLDDSGECLTGGVEELSAIPTVAAAELPTDGYDGVTDTNDFASSETLLVDQSLTDDTTDNSSDDSTTDDVTVDTDDDDFDFDSDDSSIFDDLF